MKTRIAILLSAMLMICVSALAERKTTRTSIQLNFGDETYTSEIEVSWDEEKQDDSVVILPLAEADSYFLVNRDGVRMRTTYSLYSAAKTTMDKNTAVQATRKYNVGGTTWYYITVKKSSGKVYSGYVRASMLDDVSKETFIAYGGLIGLEPSNCEILGMIRITGNNVSLRTEPNSGSAKASQANKGDVFFYMDKEDGWYQVQSGHWVKGDYVHVMTDAEVDEYMNSGDYSGETYREGDTGIMVTWIQESLKTLKYYSSEITGKFGSLTKEAVRQFQRDNGIAADGVAGPKTIAKIMVAVGEKNGGTGSVGYNPTIYNVDWFEYKTKIISGTGTYRLKDMATGRTLSIKIQSAGNHADVEPLTANDTKVLCSLYGVSNATQLETMNKWQRRAVVMTNGYGEQFVGSIYAIPHGKNTVSGNNFDGQFCVHFLNSKMHGTGVVDDNSGGHQDKIAAGVKALNALKDSNGNRITSVSTTYP